MKKLFIFIICIIAVIMAWFFKRGMVVSKAEVLEVLEDRLLVKPYDTIQNEEIYYLITPYTIIDKEIKVGDYIWARIDKKIMMSYPGQVNSFEIRIIKK